MLEAGTVELEMRVPFILKKEFLRSVGCQVGVCFVRHQASVRRQCCSQVCTPAVVVLEQDV